MRIASLLALAAAAAITASAYAEESESAPAAEESAPAAEAPAAEAPAAGDHAEAKPIPGTVVSADAEKIVIKSKKGEEKSFTITETTKIMVNGAEATIADIKADMMVKITADGDHAAKIESGKTKKEKAH
jgi:hypothetical protein